VFAPRRLGTRQRIPTLPLLCSVVAAALSTLMTSTSAAAVVIRQSEWPLDSSHFQAETIWRISQGQGITVAVVDSGVDAAHPDLAGQVLHGAGFLGDKQDNGQTDISSDSHGTAITGIIAGTGKANDGSGMTGLAPKAKILPIRVSTDGSAEPTAIAEGIKYAADHHAQVINISLGTTTPDPLLREAVNYALNKDAVVIASAGNEGQNGDPPMYPAAFPGVIDVTGVDTNNGFWPVSESGPRSTLAAPATDIYSTNNQGQYVNAEGTSYAAAYVSAAAALVRSAFPHLTAGQVIRRLITNADQGHQGSKGHDDQYGYGILDPLAALRAPAATDGGPANPLLAAHPVDTASRSSTGLVIGISATSALAVAAASTLLAMRRRRPSTKANAPRPTPSPSSGTRRSSKKTGGKKGKTRATRK